MTKWIPEDLYKQILQTMPYVCVDFIIVRNKRYLMVKRIQEPLAGEWYLPGGRLTKWETVPTAALRLAHKEVGLACNFIEELGYYMGFYYKSPLDIPIHTVSFVVLLETSRTKVKLDKNHSEYTWRDCLDEVPEQNIKQFLQKVKDKGWI